MNLLNQLDMTPQPRQPADLQNLLDEVQHSPFIGEITPEEVERLRSIDAVRFFYDGDTLVGLAAWEVIGTGWAEVGPLYTAQAYRGHGLGSFMFDMVERMHLDAGRNMYGVTKNPQVMPMFVRRGYRQIGTLALPRAIQLHLLRRLSLRKLIQHARKLRPGDSLSHYVKMCDPDQAPRTT